MCYRIVRQPKIAKDLHAEMHGYARPSGIKRTRKRAIEWLRMQAMTPWDRKAYKAYKRIEKAFMKIGVAIHE